MHKIIVIVLGCFCLVSATAQTVITKAEYFINTDPGFGKATDIPVTTSTTNYSGAFDVQIDTLPPGIHALYIRSRDANGNWSVTNSRFFYKPGQNSTAAAPNIIGAEYFFNTDPGFGKATSIAVGSPAANIQNISFNPLIDTLPTGIHVLYIRSKDANGNWSLTNSRFFYKPGQSTTAAAPNITGAEYFFDNDPGFGKAINIPVGSAATNIQNISFNPLIDTLPTGIHALYIRSRDANGNWSVTNSRFFYKPGQSTTAAAPNITGAEYFFDTDPGFGKATNIPVGSPTTNIQNISFNPLIDTLPTGIHALYIRSRNANGNWSVTNSRFFYKPGQSITAAVPNVIGAEYFIDSDPGFGKGLSIPVTAPSPNLANIPFNPDISSLSKGKHQLFVRSRDANWGWSITNAFEFTTTANPVQQYKPGSGNAINFDGVSNNNISIPNSASLNFGTGDFTIEFWYNSTNNRVETIIEKRDDGCNGTGKLWDIAKSITGEVSFYVNLNGGANVNIANVNDGKWHHLSFTRSATQLEAFKDGLLVATTPMSAQNVSNTGNLRIGSGICNDLFPGSRGFFTGSLDEIRLWKAALTQTQIRERMCHKIISTDVLYSNLSGYYNFDESTGNDIVDGTSNGNDGLLVNNPARLTSGAAIGYASSYNYVTSGLPAVNFSYNGQDRLSIAYTSGIFNGEAGTHVYVVNEKPSTEIGIAGAGTNDRYFGVFNAGITNPSYTATYNYNGNPFIKSVAETDLGLFKRSNNSDTPWVKSNATLNTTSNTLTTPGQNTEYMLGSIPCLVAAPTVSTTVQPSCTVATGTIKIKASIDTGISYSIGNGYQVDTTFAGVTPGTYGVTAKNSTGCISAVTSITINPMPPVPAKPTTTIIQPTCVDSSGTITVTAQVGSGLTYGLNGIYQTGTVFNNLTAATYNLTVKNDIGCISATTTVTINQQPASPTIPTITTSGALTFCQGGSVTLTSSAANGNTWSNGATTQSITVNSSGSYAVTVGSAGCTATSANSVVTVTPATTPTFAAIAPICAGAAAPVLPLTSLNGFAGTWSPAVVSNTSSATYTFTATSGTCVAPAVINIIVYPTPTVTLPPAQTYCNGKATTAIILNGTPSGVLFDISGGASIGLSNQTSVNAIPSFNPITGSATIAVTPMANGCIGNSISFLVSVKQGAPSQIPQLTKNGRNLSTLAYPTGSDITGYQWKRNGIDIPGATTANFYAVNSGTYTASYTNQCGNGPASNAVNFAADAISQTIIFPSIPNKTFGDAAFILNATASSLLPVNYSIVSGAAFISGNQLTVAGAGLITIEANQQGNDTFTAAAPVRQSFFVAKAIQTITIDSIPDKIYGDTSFIPLAQASSGLPVSFSLLSGNAYFNGSNLVITGAGTVTIQATQNGNPNYLPATAQRTFCVAPVKPLKIYGFTQSCISTQQYYVDAIPGATYSWFVSIGGSLVSNTGSSVSVNWTTIGLHTLSVIANNTCSSGITDTTNLEVSVINPTVPAEATNLFPVDSTIITTFPLSLSWQASETSEQYDLYIWPDGTAQPSTPSAANLSAVAYVIYSGNSLPSFAPGKKYQWKVVTKNACRQSAGVSRYFIISELPNLVLQSVLAPDTTFSGTSIDVTVKVLNNGRVPTRNVRWTDAVYLSRDSIFSPAFDILIGSSSNLAALDSGQQYSSTIKANLPQNTIGDYHLIIVTNYSNSITEATRLDDTIVRPILINLTPPPDLQVTSVIAPAEAFSGQYINVKFTVKNKGAGQTNTLKWEDYIYISPDPVFDRNTAVKIGEEKHDQSISLNQSVPSAGPFILTHLLPDSMYSSTVRVLLPSRFFGTYYLFVETDVKDSVYEFTFENNNTNRNDSIKIFLTPPPDFVVTNFQGPTIVSSQEIVNFNYQVKNIGATQPIIADRKWADGIYISKDSVFNVQNAKFLDFTLPLTRSIIVNCERLVECATCGSSSSSGSSGSGGVVYGYLPNLSLNVTPPEYCNSQLDLYRNLQYYFFIPYFGGEVSLYARGGCYEGNIGQNVPLLLYPYMVPDETYNNKIGVIIPDTLEGTYYLHLKTDITNAVFEFQQENNNNKSTKIVLVNPDLKIDSINVADTISSGTSSLVSWKLKNNGLGKVFDKNRKDMIWLSTSPVYNPSNMIRIDSITYCTAIDSFATITKQRAINIPNGLSGDYYIFIETDWNKNIFEGNNEGNNYLSRPVHINLTPWPDLTISNLQFNKDTVELDEPFRLTYQVTNQGIAGIAGKTWNDKIYVSSNPVWDSLHPGHQIANSVRSQPLDTNATYSISRDLNISESAFTGINGLSATEFYFYGFTDADQNIYEYAHENNNLIRSSKLALKNLDLAVASVTGSTTVFSGQNAALKWNVANKGGKSGALSNFWVDRVYFSVDTVFDATDTLITAEVVNGPVLANGSYNRSITYQVPNGYSGNYYVFVHADFDNRTKDINRSNNINTIRDVNGNPEPIRITLTPYPDLIVSGLDAPSIGYTGQPINIKWSVKNNGIGSTTSGRWTESIYLTTNPNNRTSGEIYLGSYTRGSNLGRDSSYSDSLRVFIPQISSGNYYLLFVTDNPTSQVYEYTYENNNSANSQIFIIQPLPSDLIVSAITNSSQAVAGDTLRINWKVKNIGANPAVGYFTQGVYLSKDSAWSADDVLLINPSVNNIYISPLQEELFSEIVRVRGIKDGKYYVVVRTDLTNNIFESNENNNTSIATDTVGITMLNLPVNVLTPRQMYPGLELYYKLEIPDSLRGETMLVSLNSNTLITPNEMYIRYGDVPTRSNFDYGYENAGSGNQEILIPALSSGSYYILLYNNSILNVQNITLLAQKISFSIRSINTNEGGNTGFVTTKIRGAKFEPNMQISLQSNTLGNIIASSVQYINSTTVFATFNFSGKPTGFYNVIAQKINGDTTSLPNGFKILKGSGGGFQGGGITPGGFYCSVKNIGVDDLLGSDIQSPSIVRRGQTFKMDINFGNSGNVDVPLPSRLLVSVTGAPISLTPGGLAENKTELYLEFKEVNGPDGILRPGATGSITIYTLGKFGGRNQIYRLIE